MSTVDRSGVIAFGSAAEATARRYAQRTGRRFHGVRLDHAEIDVASTDVVLTLNTHVTSRLMDRLFPFGPNTGSVPGLIFGATVEELETIAATIASNATGADEVRDCVELWAIADFGEMTFGRLRALGGVADPRVIRTALTEATEMATIVSHANGYDLLLGDNLVMCDAAERKRRPLSSAPCCWHSESCFRLQMPLSEVGRSAQRVAPSQLGARMVFLCSCLGIATSPGGRVWGYGPNLLASARIAAVITGWTVVVPAAEDIGFVLDRVYSGESVGRAVAALNGKAGDIRLAVLGDPNARMDPLPESRFRELGRPSHTLKSGHSEHNFVTMLAEAAAAAGTERTKELARNATDYAAGNDPALRGMAAPGDAVHDLIDVIGVLLFHYWTTLAADRRRTRSSPCGNCDAAADTYLFDFAYPQPPRRELTVCPTCGVRADVPAGTGLSLAVHGETAIITGDLPDGTWSARGHFVAQDRALNTTMRWPTDTTSGLPQRTCAIPPRRPPGPLHFAVCLVSRADICVLSVPLNNEVSS
jgi:hypothetical protein